MNEPAHVSKGFPHTMSSIQMKITNYSRMQVQKTEHKEKTQKIKCHTLKILTYSDEHETLK